MIRYKTRLLLILTLFLGVYVFLFAQDASKIVVAEVSNVFITLEDLNKAIEKYNEEIDQGRLPYAYSFTLSPTISIPEGPEDKNHLKITTREEKISFLKNEMVKKVLLYQEALRRGLDKKEGIRGSLLIKSDREIQDALSNALIEQEIATTEVKPREIGEYYTMFKELFKVTEERRIREIVVTEEQEAKDIYIKLLQGEDFATLAKTHSISPSAERGGDLGYIKKERKASISDSIAFSEALEVGGLSQIFRVSGGFCILRLEDARGGQQRQLSEMWGEIKNTISFYIQKQEIDDLVAKLAREAKIKFSENNIK